MINTQSSLAKTNIFRRLLMVGMVAVIVLAGMSVLTTQVSAQDEQPLSIAPPINKVQPATTVSDLPEPGDINALRTTYREQLTQYREDERKYIIAKEQYTRLQTLASLEEAVKATRVVMQSREELFETYFSMLYATLYATNGLEVNTKTQQLSALQQMIGSLRAHRSQIDKAQDRATLLQVQQEYSVLSPKIEDVAYKTLMYISLGRAQTVYDKTLSVTQELASYFDQNEKNPLVIAEKKRGFEEIDRNLDGVKSNFIDINKYLEQDRQRVIAGDYTYFVTQLEKVFSGLSRSVSYLEEITKSP